MTLGLALALAAPCATDPAYAQGAQPPRPQSVQPIEIQSRAIAHFGRGNGGSQKLGKLEFRGGLALSSPSPSFGGLSGLVVDADGRRFMAVTDEGAWLSGEITYSGKAPAAITGARMGPILALRGRQIDKKRDLDAEAMTLVEGALARGTVLVGFERNHRIGVFPVVDGVLEAPARYLRLPVEARRMRSNSGFEAVAVLRGGPLKGSVVAFAERFPGDATRHVGWMWVKDQPQTIGLVDHGGFDVTDAASLADGALLILERRFRWTEGVRMRLRRVAAGDLRPGAVLDGEVLLEADMSSEIDNMEGLAVHRGPAGETVLTLVSDNNFNSFLQRTLLLQFTLVDAGTAASSRR